MNCFLAGSSNTGTAKSLTSSPTRRSPVKSGITKKVGDKPAKKTATKAKKESTGETKKKPPTPRKSDGVSREMASLFDDNKFMSSSLEFEDGARGRSLRQRVQIKKEEPETPTPSTSTKTLTSGRKRQHSQTVSQLLNKVFTFSPLDYSLRTCQTTKTKEWQGGS